MFKNLSYCLKNESLLFSSLCRRTAFLKLQVGNKKCFSTSEDIYHAAPVPLSYWVFQPEAQAVSKVPVIILHGLLGSKQNWRGLGKAIAVKSQRKVYALDARNHGDIWVEGTAMYLSLTNESLVNKLVVVDISPVQLPQQSRESADYMLAMKEALNSIPKLSIVQARKEIDSILSKTVSDEGIRQFLLTNLTEKNKTLAWKANVDVLRKKFDSGVMTFPPVSGNFMKETLFICGGNSPYVKSEDIPSIKTLFPKAEILKIPEAGHWVHSEKPSDFLEAVYNFL
ncbi:hypothetical protein TNIN_218081 [Trichonephila inaurata madagascariensis]|uniref:sn-1-specific diacylglycerol lipase ABHD11 n=1 Tax=Trichonephila inaurata madagascariensis TaxID=2747483 RepID=A0A8X6X5D3_9ARAC|nr:hypothetical protein TNIN_218081 [Trichonephila inaurata madagascariensis]